MPQVNCPNCQKSYTLSDQLAGKSVRCKACSGVFTVPYTESPGVEVVEPMNHSAYPAYGKVADEIDYQIFGTEMQYVVITLDPGEQVIAEAGGMFYMNQSIKMDSVFGDPSKKEQGFWGKVASAAKRVATGESLFMTTFTNEGGMREDVAFAAPYPGKIIPMHLDQLGGEIICQRDAFLCGARGIQMEIAFNKKIGVGLFGGEGFIMQRLVGDGIACCHAGGTIFEKELAAGEMLRIDTGCIVALAPSVDYDIEFVGGIKNAIFGGEGLFMATLRGPGRIWLQSLPFSRMAGRVLAASSGYFGKTGERNVGDIAGGMFGMDLGKLFGGH